MATRDLTVRLRADIQGYRRAMQQAAAATGNFERQMFAVQRAGRALSSFGDTMTKNVTVPLVALGTAATKMAVDFDNTFGQMQGLAGVTADEVDHLKETVLGLAGETGRAPQELAEALYFIRSSGIEGSVALEVLERSAVAAAAGLGDTGAIADAVTSAINAYGASAITAAEATDVLVATAREGKAEPAELASQMGRLLPVASELEISFSDVGAGLAALSNTGNDAAASATRLGDIMAKLLRPSQQGAEALASVGLSLDDVHRSLREEGLLDTLLMLRERLGDTGFRRLFDDAQGLQGALALTGAQAEKNREIFDNLANSAGALDDAFRKSEGSGRDLERAWAQVQVALIQIGEIIAPVAADVASAIAGLVAAFQELPEPVQTALVAIGGLIAAIGPGVWTVGKLTTAFGGLMAKLSEIAVPAGTISGAFQGTATAGATLGSRLLGLAGSFSLVGAAVAAGVIAFEDYNETKQEAARISDRYTEALLREADAQEAAVDAVSASELAQGALGEKLRELEADFSIFNEAIRESGDELERLDDLQAAIPAMGLEEALERAGLAGSAFADELIRISEGLDDRELIDLIDRLDGLSDRYDEASREASNARYAEEQLENQHGESAGAIEEVAGGYEEATTALQEYARELRAQFDPIFGLVDALHQQAEANTRVEEAQQALNDAIATYGRESPEAAAAQRDLDAAQRNAAGAALDVYIATATLNDAISKNPSLLESSKRMLQTWVDQGLITQETADAMAAQFDLTAERARQLGETDPHISITANDAASPVIEQVKSIVNTIPRSVTTSWTLAVAQKVASLRDQRWGGIVRSYQGGGIHAHVARNEVIRYAEPETGGEAFIPRRGDRARSIAVLREAAGWYGLTIGPAASVAPAGTAGGGSAGSGSVRVDAKLVVTGDGALFGAINRALRTGELRWEINGQPVQVAS